MDPIIKKNQEKIINVCKKRNIISLTLFGSAVTDKFDPGKSDIDFLVEFGEMRPGEHAIQFFGFIEDMKELFHRSIDAIEPSAIQNPFFLNEIQQSKVVIYAKT